MYVYDDGGRLVSSRPEPEWDDTEREWMHALDAWKRENLCSKCGLPKSICRDRAASRSVTVPRPEACFVTQKILAAQEGFYSEENRDQAPAHEWTIEVPTIAAAPGVPG